MIHGSSIDAVSLCHPIAASKEMNGVVAAAQSAYELTTRKCTLGCPLLDRLLDGGVPCRSVTEISGESAAGKTQLCLQLLLTAQLPAAAGGLGAAALFVHSEFPFPARRLRQLATAAYPLPDPLDHVFVAAAHTPDDLLTLLDRLHAALLSPRHPGARPVRLLVVDSVAALFRSEFDNSPGDLRRRSSLFFKIGARLKLCAERFDLAVVVTNQVVDVVDGDAAGAGGGMRVGNYEGLYSSGRRVCPALGLSWANCVNTRLFLLRREVAVEAMDGSPAAVVAAPARTRRRMQVVFAPHLPEAACEFEIRREGVFGIEA